MILVLGYENFEQGTDPVLDWLIHYKADFKKITVDSLVGTQQCYAVDIYNDDIIYNGESMKKKISVVWNRRLLYDFPLKITVDNQITQRQLQKEINQEIQHQVYA